MEKNPLNFLALILLSIYRTVFSSFFGGRCRFYPSCSVYAQQAYKELPFFKASYLVILRLLKCQPLGPHGIDLVPHLERKKNAK
tara:strand:+ start:5707 stop:5958 length:252 start_codon:yes stop_codon:yes gene_type:complete